MGNKVKKWLNKFFLWFLPKCERCGSVNLSEGYYIRGYNNLCQQSCGDKGYYCFHCGKVSFIKTLEEYKKTLPEWCEAYQS